MNIEEAFNTCRMYCGYFVILNRKVKLLWLPLPKPSLEIVKPFLIGIEHIGENRVRKHEGKFPFLRFLKKGFLYRSSPKQQNKSGSGT